jgi:hypothetical protein
MRGSAFKQNRGGGVAVVEDQEVVIAEVCDGCTGF